MEARLLLGRALLAAGDEGQAATTFLAALDRAAAMPMPLRVADALDGLAHLGQRRGLREARSLAAAAAALRAPRHAVAWGYAADTPRRAGRAACPTGWIVDGEVTAAGVEAVVAALLRRPPRPATRGALDQLTTAERHVAERVADGLTSRQIAEELFISPRTVDAHLDAHLPQARHQQPPGGARRLAAMVVDQR